MPSLQEKGYLSPSYKATHPILWATLKTWLPPKGPTSKSYHVRVSSCELTGRGQRQTVHSKWNLIFSEVYFSHEFAVKFGSQECLPLQSLHWRIAFPSLFFFFTLLFSFLGSASFLFSTLCLFFFFFQLCHCHHLTLGVETVRDRCAHLKFIPEATGRCRKLAGVEFSRHEMLLYEGQGIQVELVWKCFNALKSKNVFFWVYTLRMSMLYSLTYIIFIYYI